MAPSIYSEDEHSVAHCPSRVTPGHVEMQVDGGVVERYGIVPPGTQDAQSVGAGPEHVAQEEAQALHCLSEFA